MLSKTLSNEDATVAEAGSHHSLHESVIEKRVVRKLDRNFLLLLWVLCKSEVLEYALTKP